MASLSAALRGQLTHTPPTERMQSQPRSRYGNWQASGNPV